MLTLPKKGHFRVIEDAAYYFVSELGVENMDITVGGLPTVQNTDGYFEFITDGSITNTDIIRNGVKIGEYKSDYMTIYLGDNSSCYSGNGIDFTRGVYNAKKLQEMGILEQNDGWEYSSRVHGFKTPNNSEHSEKRTAKFNFSNYYDAEGKLRIVYGQLSESDYDYVAIHDGSVTDFPQDATRYISWTKSKFGVNIENDINTNKVSPLYFTWRRDGSGSYLVNGMWIKEIGYPVFNMPLLPDEYVNEVKINVITDNGQNSSVLNGVVINITDGGSVNENIIWNNEEITLKLPKGKKYVVSTKDIQNGYKNYFAPSDIEIVLNGDEDKSVELLFTTIPVGIYPLNEDGTYDNMYDDSKTYYGVLHSSLDYDIYINKRIGKTKWGDTLVDKGISYTTKDELLVNNIDGYNNTIEIREKLGENATIANIIVNSTDMENVVKWFLPSYFEMATMVNNSDVVEMLNKIDTNIFGHTLWTSNAPDFENAWTYRSASVDNVITDIPMINPIKEEAEYIMIGKRKL